MKEDMQDFVKTVTLALEQYQCAHVLDWQFADKARFEVRYIKSIAQVVLYAIQQAAVQREIVVRYPRDWWQALKARFAPAWALRRWPVQENVVDMTVVYPRIQLPREKHAVTLRVHAADDPLPYYTR